MEKINYIAYRGMGVIGLLIFLTACELNEPFPEPDAAFTVWGVNPSTNYYEQVAEPYQLILGQTYDFIAEGDAEQFVFWFGEPGDSASKTPKGSDFTDRGINNLSKGVVARDGRTRQSFDQAASFTVVMVASSYRYADRQYKEMLVEKEVEVIAAPEK